MLFVACFCINGSSPAPPFSPGGTPPNSPPGSGFIFPPGSFVPPSSLDNGTDATLLSRSIATSILACFLKACCTCSQPVLEDSIAPNL